jgi:hypothetical protein
MHGLLTFRVPSCLANAREHAMTNAGRKLQVRQQCVLCRCRCRRRRQCSVCAKRVWREEARRRRASAGASASSSLGTSGGEHGRTGTSRGDGRRTERLLSAARPRGPPRSPCGTAAYQANRRTPTPAGSVAGQQSEPRRPSAARAPAAPAPGRAHGPGGRAGIRAVIR